MDRYGRLLRYVDVNGVDAGLRQIKQGQAVARYDSRDGYGTHARETAYVSADAASPKAACEQASSGATSGGGSTGGSAAAWPLAGDRHPCPQSRPVKGSRRLVNHAIEPRSPWRCQAGSLNCGSCGSATS